MDSEGNKEWLLEVFGDRSISDYDLNKLIVNTKTYVGFKIVRLAAMNFEQLQINKR